MSDLPDAARRWTLLATTLGFGVVQLDVSVVNVALPAIHDDLGGAPASLPWVVDAYTVVLAALILGAGALGDRIGAERVLATGFAIFTAASVACGLAPGPGWLVGVRAVQGLGGAMLVPASLSVLSHAHPEPAARARAVGLWAAGASLGLSGGPVVGGLLTELLSWRWIFFLNLPLGLLGLALTLRFAPATTRQPARRIDLPGQVLAATTLGSIAAVVIESGSRGPADPLVLGLLGVAVLAGGGFVVAERRAPDPMLPLEQFGSRVFSVCTAIGLLANVAFYGLIYVLSLYFQRVLGYSALASGLAFAPATVVVLVANLGAGVVVRRLGARLTIALAAAVVATAIAVLWLATGRGSSYPPTGVGLLLLGTGLGVLVPAMTTELLGSASVERSGVAAGTLNAARQAGSVVGVALFGALAVPDLLGGLHLSLAISLAVAALVVVLARLLPRPAPSRPA